MNFRKKLIIETFAEPHKPAISSYTLTGTIAPLAGIKTDESRYPENDRKYWMSRIVVYSPCLGGLKPDQACPVPDTGSGMTILKHRGFFKSLIILLFLAAFVFFSVLLPAGAAAAHNVEISGILTSAESLFKAMETRDYQGIWKHLSRNSRNRIVRDVDAESRKLDAELARDDIEADFEAGGPIAQAYWNSYLVHFDPDTVLRRSAWSMGTVKERSAEIIILYEKAEFPATLKMFKEDDQWKVGLDESFRGRRLLPR